MNILYYEIFIPLFITLIFILPKINDTIISIRRGYFMEHVDNITLEMLMKENELLKKQLEQKECEIINLLICRNDTRSYVNNENNMEYSDNDNVYWNSKMIEYGVSNIDEVRELMNIEAIENIESFNADGNIFDGDDYEQNKDYFFECYLNTNINYIET